MLSDEQMDIMMDDTLLPEETIAKLGRIVRNATLEEVAQTLQKIATNEQGELIVATDIASGLSIAIHKVRQMKEGKDNG